MEMEKFLWVPKGKTLEFDAPQELLAWRKEKKIHPNNTYIYTSSGFDSLQLTEHLLGTTWQTENHKVVFCFFSRSDAMNFKLIEMFTC